MSTALDHPLVVGYLHELDIALAGLPPGAAAELSGQLRAHPLEALPDGAYLRRRFLRVEPAGQIQGFEIFVYNPSDTSLRILGAPAGSISPGAPVPPQIDVSTTGSWQLVGEPDSVAYQAGGTIPPHSYRWLRVLWRSYQCYLEGPGGSQGTDRVTLRVKVGWITRTEVISLPTEFAVSPITKWPA
jgi:hypothetical protein